MWVMPVTADEAGLHQSRPPVLPKLQSPSPCLSPQISPKPSLGGVRLGLVLSSPPLDTSGGRGTFSCKTWLFPSLVFLNSWQNRLDAVTMWTDFHLKVVVWGQCDHEWIYGKLCKKAGRIRDCLECIRPCVCPQHCKEKGTGGLTMRRLHEWGLM